MNQTEKSATPAYARGQKVRYRDHHDRLHVGAVLSVDARWPGWAKAGEAPYLVYSVSHPSYRNNRINIGEQEIIEGVDE